MSTAYQPLTDPTAAVVAAPVMGSINAAEPAEQAPKETRHVFTCFFHLFFRCAALLLYLFGTLFSVLEQNFVIVFVVIVLLLAADFWTVKNVTGRKLVGLRWWNEVRDDGTNQWRFESIADRSRISDFDARVFWIGLYGAVFMWALFVLSALFSFSLRWLLVVAIALSLNIANVIGYTKSQKDARALATRFLLSNVLQRAAGGGGSGSAAPTAP